MEQAVEQGGDGGGVAEQLTPGRGVRIHGNDGVHSPALACDGDANGREDGYGRLFPPSRMEEFSRERPVQ